MTRGRITGRRMTDDRDNRAALNRRKASGLFARVDQPATGPRDAVRKNEDHRFTQGDTDQHTAQNIIKRNTGEERHIECSNTDVRLLCQAIGAEP